MKITITVNDTEFRARIARLGHNLGNLTPALREIGDLMLLSVKRNFEGEGRPGKWTKSARAQREGGQTLSDTGRLRNSFTSKVSARKVTVGTNVKYAAIHHFGGKTRAHVIRPKKGKALNIPGIGLRASVNHPGSRIPARPFLLLQEQDKASILTILQRHLDRGR